MPGRRAAEWQCLVLGAIGTERTVRYRGTQKVAERKRIAFAKELVELQATAELNRQPLFPELEAAE